MGVRYALIDKSSGEVINVIIVDPQVAWQPPEGFEIVPSDTANIGDRYVEGEFVRDETGPEEEVIAP